MLVCHRNVLHQAHDFQPKEKPMMAKENVDLLDEKYHYYLISYLEVEQTRSDKYTSMKFGIVDLYPWCQVVHLFVQKVG